MILFWFYFSWLSNRIIRINILSLETGAILSVVGSVVVYLVFSDCYWVLSVFFFFFFLFFFFFFFFFCVCFFIWVLLLHSTLVISNSKRLSEILRDIRTSTYQICRIEEKINKTTTFNKYMCNWTLDGRDILKILWKIAISPISTIFFYLLLDFHV